MIQHHGGAITMVDDLFAADGAAQDGEAFKLAADIHADQETEIARMQLMLDDIDGVADPKQLDTQRHFKFPPPEHDMTRLSSFA